MAGKIERNRPTSIQRYGFFCPYVQRTARSVDEEKREISAFVAFFIIMQISTVHINDGHEKIIARLPPVWGLIQWLELPENIRSGLNNE